MLLDDVAPTNSILNLSGSFKLTTFHGYRSFVKLTMPVSMHPYLYLGMLFNRGAQVKVLGSAGGGRLIKNPAASVPEELKFDVPWSDVAKAMPVGNSNRVQFSQVSPVSNRHMSSRSLYRTLSGVTMLNGAPTPNKKVYLLNRSNGERVATTRSDENGRYSFPRVGSYNEVFIAVAMDEDNVYACVSEEVMPDA